MHKQREGPPHRSGAATVLPGDGVYRPHPIADLFPLMDGQAIAELIEDVRQHGVREPVVLLDGKVLDGRNRYLAAREAGQPIPTREFDGDDPLAFVISVNLHRRHLDESQRGMVAAGIARLRAGDNQHSQGPSIEEASRMLNVGHSTTERARFVQDEGTPSLVAAVKAGTVSASAAADIATLPEPEQQEIVASGAKAIVAKAKHLREAKRQRPRTSDHSTKIASIRLSDDEEVWVAIDKDRAVVHVQIYATAPAGASTPTKRTISIGVERLPKLIKALQDAQADARACVDPQEQA